MTTTRTTNRASVKEKIRVCHIYYHSLNNAVLLREANSLKKLYIDVDVICLRGHKSDRVIQKKDGIIFYCIQSREEKEKKATIYFFRLILFFFKATLIVSYLRIIKKYHIIHITSPPDIMVFSAIVPKLFGAKIILDIHDINPELFMRKLAVPENNNLIKIIKYLEKVSCKFADHVITVTHIWKERLESRSVSQSKCSVLLNVPDGDIFFPAAPSKSKNLKKFNLYYHGTIDEHFGVDTLINAMPKIKQSIPNVILNIYGIGRIRDELAKLTQELKMNHFVKFHEPVPSYDLPKILINADIGIVPTKSAVFANDLLAMKSLEYLALGVPIVISKTEGHCYYYDDSMVKFFSPEDENNLADAVISLANDEAERRMLIDNSQEFLRGHGWDETKQIYYQIIDQLIS